MFGWRSGCGSQWHYTVDIARQWMLGFVPEMKRGGGGCLGDLLRDLLRAVRRRWFCRVRGGESCPASSARICSLAIAANSACVAGMEVPYCITLGERLGDSQAVAAIE